MTEEWKPISLGYYEASNLGRIRRASQGKRTFVGRLLKIQHSNRYPHVILSLGDRRLHQISVHTLVADAFLGPCPEGMEVNHKDFDKCNNRIDNLEYVTPAKNKEHTYLYGKHAHGERHGMAKLTISDVKEIRGLVDVPSKVLADRYGVSHWHINNIRRRVTWKEC